MSILDKSSLVMIPSGYKEDKLYSVKPRNGDGDFTFTRASTGTRVNSDGYIEEVPWNIFTYSEQFDNAAWPKQQSTVTADATTSPNGTTSADKLVESTSSSRHTMYQQLNGSYNNTFSCSVFVKKAERKYISLSLLTFATTSHFRAIFDVESGIVTDSYADTANGATISTSISDFGDGWYRCAIIGILSNTGSGNFFLQISLPDRSTYSGGTLDSIYPSYTGNGTSGIYIYGAQLVKGTSPKPYIKTTDRLDIPRLDYSGGATNPTLLLEPQRTNLVTYSEDFSQWTKSANNTLVSSQASPSNINTATAFQHNGTTAEYHIYRAVTLPSANITVSAYLKKGTKNWVIFRVGNICLQYFDIEDEVLGNNVFGAPISYNFVDAGNDWVRLDMTVLGNGSSNNIQIYSAESGTSSQVTGTSGELLLYVWGAQLEAGSYPTSYIPSTSGMSVTRVADVCEDAGDATIFNDSEGVIFAEIASLSNVGVVNRGISISDGSNTNQIVLRFAVTANQITSYIADGGVITAQLTHTLTNALSYNKLALKYKVNDVALWVNGTEVATDTNATMPSGFDELKFSRGDGINDFYGKCKQLIVFNEALSDSELTTLTTI